MLKPATSADRFFGDEEDDGIPRHGGDQRPKIRHADDPTKMTYWSRASSFARGVESTFILDRYGERLVARGMAISPDLCDLAAVLAGADEPEDRKELERIAGLAKTAAGGDRKANSGTALHRLRERRDRGEDLAFVPPKLYAALQAYIRITEPFDIHASEMFVVCDRWRAAGSFDLLVSPKVGYELVAPDGEIFTHEQRLIGDLKSGAHIDELGRIERAVQQVVYAYGMPYEHVSDEVAALGDSGRQYWPGDEAPDGIPMDPSRTWALLVHVPLESPNDAALWWVDLAKAAHVADEVARLHELRKLGGLIVPAEAPRPVAAQPVPSGWQGAIVEVDPIEAQVYLTRYAVLEAIELAEDQAAIDELWEKHRHEWRDEWTAAVQARLTQFPNGATEVRTS